jgi:hypothetical protein
MLYRIRDVLERTSVVWKIALASSVSWELARMTGSKHPYLAPLTVILCIQAQLGQSVQFALQRVLGTVLGVLLVTWIAPHIPINGWTLGLAILISAGIARLLRADPLFIHQVVLSILLVLYFEAKFPGYATDRIRDTLLGALIAVAIHVLVFPPDYTRKADQAIRQFAGQLESHLRAAAGWTSSGCPVNEGHTLQETLEKEFTGLHQQIGKADQSMNGLRYNPFSSRQRLKLAASRRRLDDVRQGYAHLLGMVRTLTAWAEKGPIEPVERNRWKEQLQNLADSVRRWNEGLPLPGSGVAAPGPFPACPKELEPYQYVLALHQEAAGFFSRFQGLPAGSR